MSSSSDHNLENTTPHAEHATMSKKKIWNVFWILTAITALEFIIALYIVPKGYFGSGVANPLYIILTLMKAFYIVAFFMHLKFEKLSLIYSIVVPILFIVVFIVAMLYEGNYWFITR